MCNNGITHSFTCHPYINHMCVFSPATSRYHPFGWYSLRLQWPGWVDLGGWLHIEINVPQRDCRNWNWCGIWTHPGTNRAWRRLTLLIETNALPLRQTATTDEGSIKVKVRVLIVLNASCEYRSLVVVTWDGDCQLGVISCVHHLFLACYMTFAHKACAVVAICTVV